MDSVDEDVRRGEEDGEGGDDGEHGEETETQPVDDHRRELPVAALVLEALVLAQLGRDGAQLRQDAPQQADGRRARAAAAAVDSRDAVGRARHRLGAAVDAEADRRRRAMTSARAGAPSVEPRRRVLVRRDAAASAGVEHAVVVVEVEHVGQQALGRPLTQLHLAYPACDMNTAVTSSLDTRLR